MPDPDPLQGPRLKVERAKKHIGDLETEIRNFLNADPYVVVPEDDPNTGDELYYVRVRGQPSVEWSLLIGDAVHNLRSSLDLLMWQLVLANGGTPTKDTEFPIGRSQAIFEAGAPRITKGISDDAMCVLAELKPYQGGNDALWTLHCLNIEDKHHLLIPVGTAFRHVILVAQMEGITFPGIALAPKDGPIYPVVDRTVVFRIMAAARRGMAESGTNPLRAKTDYQFAFDVALGQGSPVDGEPIIPTLVQLAHYVDGVLDAFAPFVQPVTR